MTDKEYPCEGPQLRLEVIEAGKCPLGYQLKDQFRISYPAIYPPINKPMCFLALTKANEALDKYDSKNPEACFSCPSCFENKVTFQLFEAPKNNEIHTQIADQLKGFSLFRLMNNSELNNIAKDIHLKKFEQDQQIIDIGDPGENFYIIHMGAVDIYAKDKNEEDKYNRLITLGPEDCFGEMSLLTEEPCSTRVIANTKTTLLALNKSAFHRMIQESQAINKYFFGLLANRIKTTNDKVSQQKLVGGIAGSLSALSLVEIIQIFKSSASTGILHLKVPIEDAIINICGGEIYSAKFGKFTNEEAFFELVKQKDGEFQFQRTDVEIEREIKIPTTGLLMESMRVMDENNT
ncbi:MAG: hypothetical protein COA79_10260 [Planctomycetota bacterium]|nr:MAG: hypothetical protein COA79_10260 [Planctomycetota bacterium]